jgi:hypothetical protein
LYSVTPHLRMRFCTTIVLSPSPPSFGAIDSCMTFDPPEKSKQKSYVKLVRRRREGLGMRLAALVDHS